MVLCIDLVCLLDLNFIPFYPVCFISLFSVILNHFFPNFQFQHCLSFLFNYLIVYTHSMF